MSKINIVLLGETGVGKTTFINALANHLTYDRFQDAKRSFLQLIPTTFTLTTSDLRTQTVCTGQQSNECSQIGFSATRNSIIYKLQYRHQTLQIIDTPGLGDTRGIEHDKKHASAVVNFIGQLEHVNLVCILLKPAESRLNILFNFCIQSILSQLDRNVVNNVAFVFTNGRVTSFRIGDTLQSLNSALMTASSSAAIVRCERENIFCVDNEAFRYLAARSHGIPFTTEEEEIYEQSWNRSSLEYTRLLEFALTLRPTSASTIVSVRDSKIIIAKLAKPLIELMILHERAITRIETHKKDVQTHKDSIEELKSRLYVPVTEYRTTQKTTTDTKTGQKFVAGASLRQMRFDIHGTYKFQDFKKTHCEETVEPYETRREDVTIKASILNETNRLAAVKQNLVELERLQEEYTVELSVIMEAAAKFVIFLNKNAVVVVDQDPFQSHIRSVITEERISNGRREDIDSMEHLLTRYNIKKENLTEVTPNDIKEAILNLLCLKHSGSVFRRLYNELRE